MILNQFQPNISKVHSLSQNIHKWKAFSGSHVETCIDRTSFGYQLEAFSSNLLQKIIIFCYIYQPSITWSQISALIESFHSRAQDDFETVELGESGLGRFVLKFKFSLLSFLGWWAAWCKSVSNDLLVFLGSIFSWVSSMYIVCNTKLNPGSFPIPMKLHLSIFSTVVGLPILPVPSLKLAVSRILCRV